MTKRNKLGISIPKFANHSEQKITEVLLKAENNVRASISMEELAKDREVQHIVPPHFDKFTYPHACLVEGDEVLTFRREAHGTQK